MLQESKPKREGRNDTRNLLFTRLQLNANKRENLQIPSGICYRETIPGFRNGSHFPCKSWVGLDLKLCTHAVCDL